MKRSIPSYLGLSLFAFSVLWAPSNACAHGTAYRLLKETNLEAVLFHYSDGGPIAYAEVLIFSPGDSQVEHQNGRTDKNGKFAFCPDTPGTWRITANDGMGHLCEATVAVSSDMLSEKTDKAASNVGPSVQGSNILKIITGLSLIFNLSFAAHFIYQRLGTGKRRFSDKNKEV